MESKHTLRPKIGMGTAVIVLYIVVVIVGIFRHVMQMPTKENELDVIQSMIENIELYQEDIEAWGYHVSVLPIAEKSDNKALQRYYLDHYHHPILILTDAEGGMYCFYYGFDEYTSVVSYPDIVKEVGGEYEEVQKTVRLELYKSDLYQAPFLENPNKAGVRAYYDVEVEVDVETFSAEDGKEIWAWGNGIYSTYYCSNNFIEHMRFNGLNPKENSRDEDYGIKQEYSAEQLLGFYRQGLDLQERLFALYDANS